MTKAAVIGVGYLGQYHAAKFKKNRRSELVAVVDTNPQRAKEIARAQKTDAFAQGIQRSEKSPSDMCRVLQGGLA